MYCTSCGSKNDEKNSFCISCGKPMNNKVKEVVVSNKKKSGFSKKERIVVISLLSVLVVFLLLVAIILVRPGNDKRTIMIYLDGSNLEYDSGIPTADLEAIDKSKIDFNKVNILVYTGGTKEWQNNYVSNEENAIFQLTKDGYKKIKTYEKLNMGDPNTLTTFLKFGYDNFRAGHYNLILYDHGGALDGAIYDDFTLDNLSLEDFEIALKNSPFNSRNKFDSVIFRTCLNGTLEVATLFKDYSKYIVFSEEVSYGSAFSNVLGFINNVSSSDNGYAFGKKFVDQYKKQMDDIDTFGTMGVTYSVVDLSKIDSVIEELDNFISGIDLKKDYNSISRIRGNLYQYATSGGGADSYDTIDLYSLIDELDKYSTVDSSRVKSKIDEAVLYNYTNISSSHGMSVYFPYNGMSTFKTKFLNVYKKLNASNNYRKFITNFYTLQNGSATLSFNMNETTSKVEESGKEVSLQLTSEQLKNYSTVSYVVFERDKEHPNYYYPIYRAKANVDKKGVVKTNIGNNLLSMTDEEGNSFLVPLFANSTDGLSKWYTDGAFVYDKSKSFDEKGFSYAVKLYYNYKNKKPYISNVKVSTDIDERLEGTLLDINKFDVLEVYRFEYKILDENGNYTDEWESGPEYKGYSVDLKKYKLENSSLKDNEYYVVFYIYDVNNKKHNSNLIKVGE
ncbi:MAG: hypothetical protein J6O56_02860 [Bacilli bacterium]|nr:hypothetical protein [Bacilli bacterium]